MTTETVWRFLIVDDKQADEVEEFITGNRIFDSETVVVEKCRSFSEAIDKLESLRIDLVILDVKDDSIDLDDENIQFAGEKVFSQIRQRRFIPIVFHTAYAHKVKHLEKPFVRVVSRDESRRLRTVIQEVFETRLPHLIKHLESEQREYMWDHVEEYWRDSNSSHHKTDLTYLLARRLANTLERNSIRRFLAGQEASGPAEGDDTIHPIEMYIYPSTNSKLLSGDILKGTFNDREGYWIIITPSCDLVQDKVRHVVLASCFLLEEQPEFIKVKEYKVKGENPSSSAKGDLQNLIKDNRNARFEGKSFQPERYGFLPGTFFLPNLVIDYQSLIQLPIEKITGENRIASLDSPFAEACIARFARYYGRLGTPDIDKDFVYNKILESINPQ